MLSPTFTSGKLKTMMEPMDGLAERTVLYIGEKIKQTPIIDMKPIIQGFTLDTIAKCGFGIETNVYKGQDNEFSKIAFAVFNQFRIDTYLKAHLI
jgi:cytochrome P450 family 6